MNSYETFVVMLERSGYRRAVDVFTDEREALAQAERMQKGAGPDATEALGGA